jgi:hypothetical protein
MGIVKRRLLSFFANLTIEPKFSTFSTFHMPISQSKIVAVANYEIGIKKIEIEICVRFTVFGSSVANSSINYHNAVTYHRIHIGSATCVPCRKVAIEIFCFKNCCENEMTVSLCTWRYKKQFA